MTALTEEETWEDEIYQLETTDPVEAGEDGIDNKQAKQLANRTSYLKAKVESNSEDIVTNSENIATNSKDIAAISEKIGSNVFDKASVYDVVFYAPTTTTVSVSQAFTVIVDDETLVIAVDTSVALPTMVTGTDYAIYCDSSGTLTADSDFDLTDGKQIGGFHYQNDFINEYSFWDLKFRPACSDPRGMCVDISKTQFWADIYLCNQTPDLLGTSAYGAQIADGSSCPIIPSAFAGDGSTQYSSFSQYIATEVLAAYGKRLPNNAEFAMLASGSTAEYAVGSDPITTTFDDEARSTIGCEQVSGHLWQWGIEQWDRGNGTSSYAWTESDTNSEGQVYQSGSSGVGASLFGANWGGSGYAGSRASSWGNEPWHSTSNIGARGVCDHLCLY